MSHLIHFQIFISATEIDIGIEKTEYSTHDNADYQVVCAIVESGSVGDRDIEIQYVVTDNGKQTNINFCLMG